MDKNVLPLIPLRPTCIKCLIVNESEHDFEILDFRMIDK